MKFKILLVSFFAFISVVTVNAQKSCCVSPSASNSTPETLASNSAFQAAHKAPAPMVLSPQHGTTISFPTASGKSGSAYYIHSARPTNNVLLVFHEWWGLNDYIRKESEMWQHELGDVEVYAIDLYDGKVATTAEDAGKLMSQMSAERASEIISGVLAKIGSGKNIMTLGWCMGGSWSFQAALLAGKDAKACVMYYGFPEEDQSKINNLKCDVLYIYGTKDTFITSDKVDSFDKKVVAAGRNFTRVNYDAVHAFANPSNPDFDKTNAEDARAKALAFLKKTKG